MALHQDRTSHLQGNARQRSAHSTAAEGLAMRIECRQKAEWAMQGRNPGSVVGAGHTVDTSCGVEPPHQRSEETLAAPASLIRGRKGRQAERDGEVGVAGVAASSASRGWLSTLWLTCGSHALLLSPSRARGAHRTPRRCCWPPRPRAVERQAPARARELLCWGGPSSSATSSPDRPACPSPVSRVALGFSC